MLIEVLLEGSGSPALAGVEDRLGAVALGLVLTEFLRLSHCSYFATVFGVTLGMGGTMFALGILWREQDRESRQKATEEAQSKFLRRSRDQHGCVRHL